MVQTSKGRNRCEVCSTRLFGVLTASIRVYTSMKAVNLKQHLGRNPIPYFWNIQEVMNSILRALRNLNKMTPINIKSLMKMSSMTNSTLFSKIWFICQITKANWNNASESLFLQNQASQQTQNAAIQLKTVILLLDNIYVSAFIQVQSIFFLA